MSTAFAPTTTITEADFDSMLRERAKIDPEIMEPDYESIYEDRLIGRYGDEDSGCDAAEARYEERVYGY